MRTENSAKVDAQKPLFSGAPTPVITLPSRRVLCKMLVRVLAGAVWLQY